MKGISVISVNFLKHLVIAIETIRAFYQHFFFNLLTFQFLLNLLILSELNSSHICSFQHLELFLWTNYCLKVNKVQRNLSFYNYIFFAV